MKTISLILSAFLVFSCGQSRLITKNTNTSNFTSKNDTIFYNSQPSGVVIHYGLLVDKKNHYNRLIVINDISNVESNDDIELGMINYVHKVHPSSVVEVRTK